MTDYNEPQVSVCPAGKAFPLPQDDEYAAEFQRLQALVAEHRRQGHEIVVVMGVGFVGAVMAGVVADSVDKKPASPINLSSACSVRPPALSGKFPI